MTDFFTRLAEHTLGRAPVAEPLVAPSFAPAASWTVTEGLATPTEAQQTPPSPPIPSQRAEPPTAETAVPLPTLVPESPAEAHAPARVGPAAKPMVEKERPAASSVSKPAPAGRPAPKAAPEKARTEEPRVVQAHPTPESTPVAIQPPVPETTRRALARSAPALPVDVPQLVALESAPAQQHPAKPLPPTPKAETVQETPPIQHAIKVETRVASPAQTPPPPQPSVTRQARQSTAMPPSQSLTAEPAPQPPAIRVTIGRVEVRAVQPPEPFLPRPRPAMRMPAVSLDDYLRRRNGG